MTINFHHQERMLSFIERWNIAPRLHRQNVAEHSFYVALYSDKLAMILGLCPEQRMDIVSAALRHDVAEVKTGDSPGPAKRAVTDEEKLYRYEREFLATLGDDYSTTIEPAVALVIKAADTIDAWYYLMGEVAHGNQLLKREAVIALDRMRLALEPLGLRELAYYIKKEGEKFLDGIDLAPRLDTDLAPLS